MPKCGSGRPALRLVHRPAIELDTLHRGAQRVKPLAGLACSGVQVPYQPVAHLTQVRHRKGADLGPERRIHLLEDRRRVGFGRTGHDPGSATLRLPPDGGGAAETRASLLAILRR